MGVEHGGKTYRIRAKKVRTLLTVLALHAGRTVSWDTLVGELWPGKDLANSRNALHANTARLRKLLESWDLDAQPNDVVVTANNSYLLDVPADATDAARFLRLASRGSELLRKAPEQAGSVLNEALELWRGPALLDAGEGLLCRSTAAQLEERLMTIREDLITAKLHTGRERDVIADLQELVVAHPGRERFSEQLMIALYRCGRQSEALDVYRRTRAWLVDELGLDVGRSLHELYQSVIAQDPVLDARN
ncbi:BTAD domain-containing putative transcriptional regulator [Streptomyces rimosus]|uniref:AfsR/SARP family transcriptional regulator n=1 Tax=Streptomyces rimosus TaxID=1927 RepID=UPI001F3EC6E7|nr:AfsR/SARP family transcriptional regulator [Streptomyces rimosus]